jgi:hypothetical protein
MTDEPTNKPQENAANFSLPTFPAVKYKGAKVVNGKEQGSPKADDNTSPNKETPIQVEKRKKWKIDHTLTVVGIFVNIALLIATYKLWKEAVNAGKSATTAAIASKESAEQAKESNKLAKQSADSSQGMNKQAIDVSKQSLDAQINSIKETQKQFEVANRPVIQINNIKVETFEQGKPTRITFNIANFGKYPAKIFKSQSKIVYSIDPDFKDFSYLNDSITKYSLYVGGENSTPFFAQEVKNELKKFIYDQVNDGERFIYLIGKFNYLNLVMNQEAIYRFIIRIKMFPNFEATPLEAPD